MPNEAWPRAVVFACGAWLLVALPRCGGGNNTPAGDAAGGDAAAGDADIELPLQTEHGPIGPGGGQLVSADGHARLVVPPGALTDTLEFSLRPTNEGPDGALPGTTFAIEPDGTEFAVPARLEIDFAPADVPLAMGGAELRIAKAVDGAWLLLDAVSPVAGRVDRLEARLSGLSTYGVVPPAAPEPAAIVYVVDEPPAGSTTQFRELPPALDALCAAMEPGAFGALVVDTDRTLAVTQLAPTCPVKIVVAAGRTARVAGPGSAPLVIDASQAAALVGLTFENAGGVVINANGPFALVGLTFPARAEIVAGGVAGAPYASGDPATAKRAFKSETPAAPDYSGLFNPDAIDRVCRAMFGEQLKFRLNEATYSGKWEFKSNHFKAFSFDGLASFTGNAETQIAYNWFELLDIKAHLGGNATVTVDDHRNLQRAAIDWEVTEEPTGNFTANLINDFDFHVLGLGSLTLNTRQNVFGDATFSWGCSNFSISEAFSEFDNVDYVMLGLLGAVLYPTLVYSSVGLKVNHKFTFTALDESFGDYRVTAGFKDAQIGGEFTVDLGGAYAGTYENVKFGGELHWLINGNHHYADQFFSEANGKVFVTTQGAMASLSWSVTGGGFRDDIYIERDQRVAVSVHMDGNFLKKLNLARVFGLDKLDADAVPHGFKAEGDEPPPGVWLSGVGSAEQPIEMVEVSDIDGPLTVENCVFGGVAQPLMPGMVPALAAAGVEGPITVRNCQFAGCRPEIDESSGPVLFENNTLDGAFAGLGIMFVPGGATVQGNALSVDTAGSHIATVALQECPTLLQDNDITGTVQVTKGVAHVIGNRIVGGLAALPDSLLRIEDNTFTVAGDEFCISDAAVPEGALVNDPVQANGGITGENVWTAVDFDGNGCADYPPEGNEIRDGRCVRDGYPPPADPGL